MLITLINTRSHSGHHRDVLSACNILFVCLSGCPQVLCPQLPQRAECPDSLLRNYLEIIEPVPWLFSPRRILSISVQKHQTWCSSTLKADNESHFIRYDSFSLRIIRDFLKYFSLSRNMEKTQSMCLIRPQRTCSGGSRAAGTTHRLTKPIISSK